MAFPTVPTVAAGRVLSATQANGAALRTFPSLSGLTKNSGDLLIAICVAYQSSASANAVFSAWGGGFTEVADRGGTTSNMSIGVAWKQSDGTETGTFTVTQAATVTGHAAMFLLSIPGAYPALAPVVGNIVNGTAAAADINSTATGWGVQDTLWIALAGSGETATAGSYQGVTSAPTNYTGLVLTGISSDVQGGVEAAVAFRQLSASSEDPGGFGVDTSNARNSALLLAVRPAPIRVTLVEAQETDSPQAITGFTISRNITAATETNAVGEIVPLQPLPATETDEAFSATFPLDSSITTATETDSAEALNLDKAVTITQAEETDTIPSSGVLLTPATETDEATALSFAAYALTPATETDLANEIAELQPLPAETTDAPQALVITQSELVLTAVTESAEAQVLSFTQGGGYLLTAATETDLANEIVSFQPLPATETTSALALDYIYGGKNLSPALETDTAVAIAPVTGITLPVWEATIPLPYNVQVAVGDESTAVALSFTTGTGAFKTILPATETDTAHAAGPELLPNGGFELGDAHWDTSGSMSMQARTYLQEPTVPVLSGSSLLLVEALANNGAIITEPDEWIAVTPGGQYTFSAWFYSPVAFNPAIGVNPYTSSLALAGSSANSGTVVPANTWTKLVHTVTAGPTTVWFQLSIYLATGAPKEFYIDSVSLKLDAAAITISKRVPLTTVTTTASAQALTKSKAYNITTATSTGTAAGLTFTQTSGTTLTIDEANETDTATAVVLLKEIFITLGIATEVDLARFVRAANRPTGGLALIDHDPDSGLILTDAPPITDLALIDI